MYTSCGWFFDEISGTETVQILMYAGRVIQLAEESCEADLEPAFLEQLARAPSNLPHLHPTGREVYQKYVRPARLTWQNIAAHYAIASLFQSFEEMSHVFCYDVVQKDVLRHEAGKVKLVVGHARLDSEITLESWDFAYAALHLGDHNVNAGIVAYPGDAAYEEIAAGAGRGLRPRGHAAGPSPYGPPRSAKPATPSPRCSGTCSGKCSRGCCARG